MEITLTFCTIINTSFCYAIKIVNKLWYLNSTIFFESYMILMKIKNKKQPLTVRLEQVKHPSFSVFVSLREKFRSLQILNDLIKLTL